MVEYARRVRGDSDSEDQLQRFQHPLRRLELDSSNLLVVSDRSIHIVLINLEVSIGSVKPKSSFRTCSRKKHLGGNVS